MVDFKKMTAGKRSKLADKKLDGPASSIDSGLLEQYTDGNLYKIPLESITPDPDQPRKHFDKGKLKELADSIKTKGVLQPIIVRKNDNKDIDTEFLVIAGERRFRASTMAELDTIPAMYSTGNPAEIALIENLQRDDLKPVEEAEAYQRIIDSHGYSLSQLGSVVGKSKSSISETLSLNKLPQEVKEGVRTSEYSKSVLLEISKRNSHEEMVDLFEKIKDKDFTVAKIRQITRPKAERKTTTAEDRVLSKILETKKLVPKINSTEISDENKKKLWDEFNDLHRIMTNMINQ